MEGRGYDLPKDKRSKTFRGRSLVAIPKADTSRDVPFHEQGEEMVRSEVGLSHVGESTGIG